jgi:hypothetical protein
MAFKEPAVSAQATLRLTLLYYTWRKITCPWAESWLNFLRVTPQTGQLTI